MERQKKRQANNRKAAAKRRAAEEEDYDRAVFLNHKKVSHFKKYLKWDTEMMDKINQLAKKAKKEKLVDKHYKHLDTLAKIRNHIIEEYYKRFTSYRTEFDGYNDMKEVIKVFKLAPERTLDIEKPDWNDPKDIYTAYQYSPTGSRVVRYYDL